MPNSPCIQIHYSSTDHFSSLVLCYIVFEGNDDNRHNTSLNVQMCIYILPRLHTIKYLFYSIITIITPDHLHTFHISHNEQSQVLNDLA